MEMLSHPVSSPTADILIVGGGGSGGTIMGSGLDLGGGGAGGLIHLVGYLLSMDCIPQLLVVVRRVSSEPTRGENSSLSGNGFSYTAIGGGSGGGLYPASSGGSGGGAARMTAPGLGTPGQGITVVALLLIIMVGVVVVVVVRVLVHPPVVWVDLVPQYGMKYMLWVVCLQAVRVSWW